jgi:hypothetical protein
MPRERDFMKITRFSLSTAGSDGEMPCDAEISVINPTAEIVRLLTTTAAVLDADGSPLASGGVLLEECVVDPGDRYTCSVPINGIPDTLENLDSERLTLTVSATLHARDYLKLGEVAVPHAARGWATLERGVAFGSIESPVRVHVYRCDPDENGESMLRWCGMVRNTAGCSLKCVRIKCDLLGAGGSLIDSAESSRLKHIPAGALGDISGEFWSMRDSRLKDARLRFSLSVFRPVHTVTCSAPSSSDDE